MESLRAPSTSLIYKSPKMKFPNMMIWAIVILWFAHNEPSSATTFSIPENSKVYFKDSELHLWNALSFAFKTQSSGVLIQQPEFINFQDFVQIILTDAGHLRLHWRYKGQPGTLDPTSGQTNLSDGNWHVVHFTYKNLNLTLKIDDLKEETVTSLTESPTLFSVRVSQQDSRVVVGQSVEGVLCFQTGENLGLHKFWIAEGNVLMSDGSVENCQPENLRSGEFGLTNLGSCSEDSQICSNQKQECYLLAYVENCACPEGNTGANCDETIQPCDHRYCGSNGMCKSVDNIPFCDCNGNYSGDFCEVQSLGCEANQFGYAIGDLNQCYSKPSCSPSPCKNKGKCDEESQSNLLPYTCECPSGFSGHDCEINLDDCQDGSCSGNGICVDLRNDHVCYCNTGWRGAECSQQFDVCSIFKPCINGNCSNTLIGSEADGTDQPYFDCECEEGWSGRQCEKNVNECEVFAPCQNGAPCSDNEGSYECICSTDWGGKNCTENVDRCLNNEACGEHRTCKDEEEGFSCSCFGTHAGQFCNESICAPVLYTCLNGTTCIVEDDGYNCSCTEYFQGVNCSEGQPLCEDEAEKCPNGQFCKVPQLNETGYECVCPEGFEGVNCDSVIECNSTCTHGNCSIQNNASICDCDSSSGYEGVLCNENIDNCASDPDPCNGGTCEDGVNGFKCINCPNGFTGTRCENDVNECSQSTCQNSGSCVDLVGGYRCDCLEGYSGKDCETDINECDPNLCLNGGMCDNLIGWYECNCSGTGYTGSNCQTEIKECAGNPCQNGGTCTNKRNSYTCDCSDTGFEGDLCQITIDECLREEVICYHGGECRDEVNGFQCDCNQGFSGIYCQDDYPDCLTNPCKNNGICLEVSKTENYPRIKPLIKNRDFDYKNAAGFACECAEGFEGSTCGEAVNYCELEIKCVTEQTFDCLSKSPNEGYYSCECKDGFEGQFCESNIDDCEENPCENDAICVDGDNDYFCQCIGLFVGKDCSFPMTGCDNVICQNEGTCEPTYTKDEHGYFCECAPGYTGDNCETFTDLSLTLPFNYVTNPESDHLDLSLRMQTTLTLMVIASSDLFQLEVDVTGKLNFTIFGSSMESQTAVNHGEWVEVVVKYEKAEATLRYRDTKCDDWCESSSAIAESENFSFSPIIVGSNVNYNEISKFVGCVEDFKVNSELLVGGQKGVPRSTSKCVRVEQCGQMSCNAQGRCIDLWSKFECQCFDMYAGEFCQEELSAGTFNFNNNCGSDGSWAEYVLEGSNQVMEISFHVKTVEDTGLIYQHGEWNRFEILLKIVDSKLVLRLGDEDNATDFYISDGEPHKIVMNYGRDSGDYEFRLFIDDSFNNSWIRPSMFDVPLLDAIRLSSIFFSHQNVDLKPLGLNSFKGCISDVRATVIDWKDDITKMSLKFSEKGFDVGGYLPKNFSYLNCVEAGCKSDPLCDNNPCQNGGKCELTWNAYTCNCTSEFAGDNCNDTNYCNSNTCHQNDSCTNVEEGFECQDFISFDEASSFVKASMSDAVKSETFSTIQLTIRTRESESLLFFMEGVGGCYVSGQLAGGNIRIDFKFDQQSNAETVEVDENLADGNIKHVKIEFTTDNKTIVTVIDVELLSATLSSFQKPTLDCVASQTLLIGGLDDRNSIQDVESKIPSSPPDFDGCMSNFRINNLFVPFYRNAFSASLNTFNFESSLGVTVGCSGGNYCFEANCNNGACREIWRSYECHCQPGYEGDNCNEDIDDCMGHQCQNEGTCNDGVTKYQCICGERYRGQFCEEDVNECDDPNFCFNGGNCTNTFGSFSCECKPDWTGDRCDVLTINILTCEVNNPCSNNGICMNTPGSELKFKCSCDPGFEGVRCEHEMDLCADHPCKNAHNCTTEIDKDAKTATYMCSCMDGFTGKDCKTQEVAKICEGYSCNENGHCEVLSNEPICRCSPGFRGVKCQADIDECKEGEYPCAENNLIECVNSDGSYECRCENGWEGEDCTEEKKYCEEDEPCLNGGTCNEELAPGTFSCNCGATGYYGDLCEIPCKVNNRSCLNDGTCEVSRASNLSVVRTECNCADGFEGDLCEDKTDSDSQFIKFAGSAKGIVVFVLLGVLIILMVAVVLLVIIHRLKRSRAKSGDYFPRPTERMVNVFQIPVESDLQLPKEERLI